MQKQFEAFFFGEVKILLKNVEFLLIEKFEFIVDYIFGRAEEFACLFLGNWRGTLSKPNSLTCAIKLRISY